MKKLLSMLIPILALAVGTSAQTVSKPASLTSRSTVVESANNNVQDPQDDPLLKGCQLCVSRLTAANDRIASLTQLLADKDAIIAASKELLGIKDQTIANLKQIDTNSQKVDTNSQDIARVFREQISDDKLVKVALENKLESCRSQQKFIALGTALTAGYLGYQFGKRGIGIQNPITSGGTQFLIAGNGQAQRDYFQLNFAQSNTERRLRAALRSLQK